MNKSLLSLACLILCGMPAIAQQTGPAERSGEPSLAERVFGLEQKQKKLKVYLGLQSF